MTNFGGFFLQIFYIGNWRNETFQPEMTEGGGDLVLMKYTDANS